MDKLESILLNVRDSYSDFVLGILSDITENPEWKDPLIAFIESKPEADSSDIIEWCGVNIYEIDYDNPPELVLVDDDEE